MVAMAPAIVSFPINKTVNSMVDRSIVMFVYQRVDLPTVGHLLGSVDTIV